MSVTGICQVCETARADHACRTCGRQVCTEHWSDAIGACSACARGLDGGGGSDPDNSTDRHW